MIARAGPRSARAWLGVGLVAVLALAPCSRAAAQELLLPEWEFEASEDTGAVKRTAGEGAELGWGFLNETLSDTWSMTRSPIDWRWKGWLTTAAIAGATTGLVYGVDQRVRDASKDNQSFEDFGEGIRWLGNGPGLVALTGGFALTGLVFDRPKERETAWLLLEASAAGFVFTAAGKYTFGRSRPNEELGPYQFDPFSGEVSLPSGEATSAFIMAGVVTSQYPQWWVQLTAYSLAGAVGAGRIGLDAHWTSDVFLGAALGIAVSKATVHFHRKREAARRERREREKLERERGETARAPREPERRHFVQLSPRAFRWTVTF
jgi:hypothetical protein